jgi:hypothetical protein
MPYTAGQADLTVGPRIAAQGIQSAMSDISGVLQKVGMLHLQDQQSGAIMDAYKAAGYFDDQPGKPGSAMLPSALMAAANKGPLGTKTAVAGVVNNYLQLQYQMRMAAQKYGYEQGGLHQGGSGGVTQTPPPAGGGGGGGGGFDVQPGAGAGMNANPWNPTGSSDQAE